MKFDMELVGDDRVNLGAGDINSWYFHNSFFGVVFLLRCSVDSGHDLVVGEGNAIPRV